MEGLPVLERVIIEPEDIDLELYRKIGEEVVWWNISPDNCI